MNYGKRLAYLLYVVLILVILGVLVSEFMRASSEKELVSVLNFSGAIALGFPAIRQAIGNWRFRRLASLKSRGKIPEDLFNSLFRAQLEEFVEVSAIDILLLVAGPLLLACGFAVDLGWIKFVVGPAS